MRDMSMWQCRRFTRRFQAAARKSTSTMMRRWSATVPAASSSSCIRMHLIWRSHKGSFTLQRYKGLGEMDAEQLWETTLDPKRRLLKRIEIEDGRMASDITELLMGNDVPPRKTFIYEHATDATVDA